MAEAAHDGQGDRECGRYQQWREDRPVAGRVGGVNRFHGLALLSVRGPQARIGDLGGHDPCAQQVAEHQWDRGQAQEEVGQAQTQDVAGTGERDQNGHRAGREGEARSGTHARGAVVKRLTQYECGQDRGVDEEAAGGHPGAKTGRRGPELRAQPRGIADHGARGGPGYRGGQCEADGQAKDGGKKRVHLPMVTGATVMVHSVTDRTRFPQCAALRSGGGGPVVWHLPKTAGLPPWRDQVHQLPGAMEPAQVRT